LAHPVSDLRVSVAGIAFRNPFLLASGVWGESGDSLAGAWNAGAGAVITKSIGREARPGYPNPTVEMLGRWGFLNAMGLPNPGIDEYPKEVEGARAAGAMVIGSVFGHDAEEFAVLADRLAATGVVAIELNLSCPHAEGYGSEIGQDPEEVERVTRAVVRRVHVPVIAKLTPNTSDPVALATAAERGGAAAVSAINTIRAISIDVRLRRPTLSHGIGGLSGPAIKPVGLAFVWQIYGKISIPIIGIGGIMTAEDALEYIMAGASAVEVGTAVAFDGVGVFGQLSTGLSSLLDELGIARVADAIGAAHRRPGDDPGVGVSRAAPPRGS
jgi:dihydroorotate dehydrogenase (NAD+) catalytic subunit